LNLLLSNTMDGKEEKIMENFDKLEKVAYSAVKTIEGLKSTNKELRDEVNELKRLLALSEKKAERLKQEVDELKSNGEQSWKTKEKDIKNRLVQLSAKISAFEKSYTYES